MRVLPLDEHVSPSTLRSWHDLSRTTDRELEPHLPPPDLDEARAFASSDDLNARRCLLALDGDRVVGYAVVKLPLLDNLHLAEIDVRVDPGRRRARVGTALAAASAAAAKNAGRRTLLMEATEGSAGDTFCASLGGELALSETGSMLLLARLDRSRVDDWIARRHERAAGHSLVRWVGRCPEDLVKGFAEIRNSMSTAPLGGLDVEVAWSPETIRAAERAHVLHRHRNLVVCARDDVTGDLVALTDVLVPDGRPTMAFQEDTVVRPDHRERGLGRWVKAEMLRWLAAEAPKLERIVTWNATDNAAMRGINAELGFAPTDTWNEWQFHADALAADAPS
jgi:GNAT superfamily N-acetyltransferase